MVSEVFYSHQSILQCISFTEETRRAQLDALIGAINRGNGSKMGCNCIPTQLPSRSRPSEYLTLRAPWVSLIPCELLECVVTEKHIHSIIKCVKWRISDFFKKEVLQRVENEQSSIVNFGVRLTKNLLFQFKCGKLSNSAGLNARRRPLGSLDVEKRPNRANGRNLVEIRRRINIQIWMLQIPNQPCRNADIVIRTTNITASFRRSFDVQI